MFWIVLIVLSIMAGVGGIALMNNAGNKSLETRLILMFQEMEEKYEDFVKQQLKHLPPDQVTSEALIAQSYTILKPDLEALLAVIQGNHSPKFQLDYPLQYFKNIGSHVERSLRSSQSFSKAMEEKFHELLKDAIEADLMQRFLKPPPEQDALPS